MALLALVVLVPLVFAPLVYLLGARLGRSSGYVTSAGLAFSTFLTLISASQGGTVESYPWYPIGTFGLRADGISIPVLFTIAILSTVIAVYSIPYMAHRMEGQEQGFGLYFALYLLYAAGMMGTVLATNLIEFYLFFELMLIPSYFLIAKWGYGDRDKISFMYFMWTHIGALVFLAGILATWLLSSSFDLTQIVSARIPEATRAWVAGLLLVGLLVKMAVFGLHIWLPYAHAEAPAPISALLSPAMIGIGGYAIIRIVLAVFPTGFREIATAVSIWAVVTMVYGGLMALMQDDIKRMMAYSSVSQMGYILLGIASVQVLGVSGSLFHYVSHGMGKGILFMVAGAIMLQAHGLRSIGKMGGLAARMPVTATVAILGFLTIIGVPPLSGFISEVLIFIGTFQSGLQKASLLRIAIGFAAVISTALTAGYGLWTIRRVFFGSLPQELQGVREAPASVTVPLLILAFIAVVLGIYPELVTGYIIPSVKLLMAG